MSPSRRLFPWLAVVLGALGVVACAAATVLVCYAGVRLNRICDNLFEGIDQALAAVQNRVLSAQTRVEESKITTDDIEESVKNWTRKEASERLASRLELEQKSDQLAGGLRQADLGLELSETSLQGVQRALELLSMRGAPVDVALVDPLLEKLGTLRRQLNQATETVDAIHERLADGESLDERIDDVALFVARVVATVGELDVRIGEIAERLGDAKTNARNVESRTHTYIVCAVILAILLIAWMAAGQVSLCRHGWKDRRQGPSAA